MESTTREQENNQEEKEEQQQETDQITYQPQYHHTDTIRNTIHK